MRPAAKVSRARKTTGVGKTYKGVDIHQDIENVDISIHRAPRLHSPGDVHVLAGDPQAFAQRSVTMEVRGHVRAIGVGCAKDGVKDLTAVADEDSAGEVEIDEQIVQRLRDLGYIE